MFLPGVLFVHPSGTVHNAPGPASWETMLDPWKRNANLIAAHQQLKAVQESSNTIGHRDSQAATPSTENQTANNPVNSRCTSEACTASKIASVPVTASQIVNPSFLAVPRLTPIVSMEGLSAMPDAALCIVISHLDKLSKMQLAGTCKALALEVFTRQQQQATLVVSDTYNQKDGLLAVLSWLPVTAWRLGCPKAINLWANSNYRNLLDQLMGLNKTSIQTSSFAEQHKQLRDWDLFNLWDSYLAGGTWKPILQYPSIVHVTLQGMELAFIVPPALAIACPTIKKLTLVHCSVGKTFDASLVAAAMTTRKQPAEHAIAMQLFSETVCSSLEAMELKYVTVSCGMPANQNARHGHCGMPDMDLISIWSKLTPELISRNLPSLRQIKAISSTVSDALLYAFGKTVDVVELEGGGFWPFLPLPAQLVGTFLELHTLSLPRETLSGSDFAMLESMPKLHTLAVYDFRLQHDEDYRKYNTHIQNLHIRSNTMDLTTLGRLPLQSLKNDPVSGRPNLEVMLPYIHSISETIKAVDNMKSCRSSPFTVSRLCFRAHVRDMSEDDTHAVMLLNLLTAFQAKEITFSKVVLGNGFVRLVEQRHISNVELLELDRCKIRADPIPFWQSMLQRFPKLRQVTVKQFMQYRHVELKQLIQSLCQAWASVRHQHCLSVTVGPSVVDLDKTRRDLRDSVPPTIDLMLQPDTVCIEERPPSTPKHNRSEPSYMVNVDRPAVVTKIGPAAEWRRGDIQ